MENGQDEEALRARKRAENEAFLAKIRKTIHESNAMIEAVDRRIAETDDLLASLGMTRAQLEAMTFTEDQKKAVNDELVRRGFAPLEDEPEMSRADDERLTGHGRAQDLDMNAGDGDGDAENRRRKFNVMMKQYRL